ncbi:SprT family zinc-dependent metalloprotease [Gracilibacillus sp. YIM 98692]|uniref:M48 family metallopeptidase n=1 Tax=Gracilibacillus sp. YIM 98692 TaxID=2663532 RepID=UPI0013D8DB8A|nr:SprT family zinc-dependent metalloprotease [Gracilibacillus sp. YIM 98692]
MPTINFGTTIIYYNYFIQNRKDVKISIDLVNGVEIYKPRNVSKSKLNDILIQKAPWINQKLEELNEVKTSVQQKEFVSGEKLPYLGRHYRLKVFKEPVKTASIQLKQGRFIAVVPHDWTQYQIQDLLEQQLIAWYRQHGFKKIIERAKDYQAILGVEPRSIQLRTQHRRWGTCTPNGDIYLNWRMVMAPVRVIDYIIVHELVHLLVPQHNDKFWRLVKSTLPHYEHSKEWLRVHGVELHCIG